MNFTLRSPKVVDFESVSWHESASLAGVRFAIKRISLNQRIEFTRKIRELALRNDFLKAGNLTEQLEAALADLLTRRLYLEWGLVEIRGLNIDGKAATTELLCEKGPEGLSDEIISVIHGELGLSEEERKNS